MRAFLRRAYLIAVFVWMCMILAFPTWRGRTYLREIDSERWINSGAFGITGSGNPMTSVAPIWHPPRSSGGLPTTVRLPLSPVTGRHHIEIAIAICFWKLTTGVMLAGLVYGLVGWLGTRMGRRAEHDRVLVVAFGIALGLLTANILLFFLAAISMGMAVTGPILGGVLTAGAVLGGLLGSVVKTSSVDSVQGDRAAKATYPNQADTAVSEDSETKSDSGRPSKLRQMHRLSWWWRVPAYLVAQFFILLFVRGLGWPIGRDVFGPYTTIPEWVNLAYGIQFIVLPFLPWRWIAFVLGQFAIAGMLATVPDWPRTDNVFGPQILVPAWAWVMYWLQFTLVGLAEWALPRLIRSKHSNRSRRSI